MKFDENSIFWGGGNKFKAVVSGLCAGRFWAFAQFEPHVEIGKKEVYFSHSPMWRARSAV